MNVSQAGLDLIKKWEGFQSVAYYDPVGVLTIGYGTTRINGKPIQVGQTITKAEAEKLLKQQVEEHASNTFKFIKVNLTQNQFDALASFQYNLGSNILSGSTLLTYINNQEWEKAANKMLEYNKAGGKVLEGLTNRRKEEVAMFLNGASASTSSKLNSPYKKGDASKWTSGDKAGLDTNFLGRLARLGEDIGEVVSITSGYRTIEKQTQLWNDSDKSGKMVAAPGRSRHNYGLAVDVGNAKIKAMSNSQLSKYGLYKPMDYENWHIEPIETKGKTLEQIKALSSVGISDQSSDTSSSSSGSSILDRLLNRNQVEYDDAEAGAFTLFKQVDEMSSLEELDLSKPFDFVIKNSKAVATRTLVVLAGLLVLIFGLLQLVNASKEIIVDEVKEVI